MPSKHTSQEVRKLDPVPCLEWTKDVKNGNMCQRWGKMLMMFDLLGF